MNLDLGDMVLSSYLLMNVDSKSVQCKTRLDIGEPFKDENLYYYLYYYLSISLTSFSTIITAMLEE